MIFGESHITRRETNLSNLLGGCALAVAALRMTAKKARLAPGFWAGEGTRPYVLKYHPPLRCLCYGLNIVVQGKLIGMRTQPNGIHFLRAFVVDVGAEQLFGEDVAFQQEGVIFVESVQGILERTRH